MLSNLFRHCTSAVLGTLAIVLLSLNSYADNFASQLPQTEGKLWAGFDIDCNSPTCAGYTSINMMIPDSNGNLIGQKIGTGVYKDVTGVNKDVTLTLTTHKSDQARNRNTANFTLSRDFIFNGVWTFSNSVGEKVFTQTHTPTFDNPNTWSFSRYFLTGASSDFLLTGDKASQAYTMLNGIQLEVIDKAHSDYTWNASDNNQYWNANYWLKTDGSGKRGTPEAGDLCYVENKWIRVPSDGASFAPTLLLGTKGELLIGHTPCTVNDLVLNGGGIHQGSNGDAAVLNGNVYVAGDSYIDIDDPTHDRTVQINSKISGTGAINVMGRTDSLRSLILNSANPDYSGEYILNNSVLNANVAGALDGASVTLKGNSSANFTGPQIIDQLKMTEGTGAVTATDDLTIAHLIKDLEDILTVSGNLTLSELTLYLPDDFDVTQPFETGIETENLLDFASIVTTAILNDEIFPLSLVNDSGEIRGQFASAEGVPEPSTWALLIIGSAGLLYFRRRK